MKTLHGHYGEVRFQDCLEGMQTLQCSFNFTITDPPYNIELNKGSGLGDKPVTKSKTQYYNDNDPNYEFFCKKWGDLAFEKSENLVFTPGPNNLGIWYRWKEPYDMFIWDKPNAVGGGKVGVFRKYEPVLVYGKNFQTMVLDVIKNGGISMHVENGFLLKQTNSKLLQLKHPCPKSYNFWYWLIETFHPKSILDPFIGSGTTCQIAEALGIPYLGFEINETKYYQDIQLRIKLGIQAHDSYKKQKKKQLTLG